MKWWFIITSLFLSLYRTDALEVRITCDDILKFYIDGVLQNNPNGNQWDQIDVIPNIPSSSSTLAVHCHNTGGAAAIIVALSDGRVSNTQDWKCYPYEESGWTSANFNDNHWWTPVSFGSATSNSIWNHVSGITDNAHWIWTRGPDNNPPDTTVYCRTSITTNGNWGSWSSWTTSCTCPSGSYASSHSRSRQCDNPPPFGVGAITCPGSSTETRSCNCPKDYSWNNWQAWGSCSQTCGSGSQTRTRTCDPPLYGGTACPRSSESQTQACNTVSCPYYGNWGSWGSCSCPSNTYSGTKTRTKPCIDPTNTGASCTASTPTSSTGCNCPRDGGWSSWSSSWSVCSCSAGTYNGTQEKTRTCTNPTPAYGGNDCPGSNTTSQSCNCPRDGGWTGWSGSWTNCSCLAGTYNGTQEKYRTCTDPTPAYGGNNCPGNDIWIQDCNCPKDGGWSNWTVLSCECPQGSYSGERYMNRSCSNPIPMYNGSDCVGNSTATEVCSCPQYGSSSQTGVSTPILAAAVAGAVGLAALGAVTFMVVLRRLKKKKEEEEKNKSRPQTSSSEANDGMVVEDAEQGDCTDISW